MPPRADGLTPRQREVADLIAAGMTSRQIAARLGLSRQAVDSHRRLVRATATSAALRADYPAATVRADWRALAAMATRNERLREGER